MARAFSEPPTHVSRSLTATPSPTLLFVPFGDASFDKQLPRDPCRFAHYSQALMSVSLATRGESLKKICCRISEESRPPRSGAGPVEVNAAAFFNPYTASNFQITLASYGAMKKSILRSFWFRYFRGVIGRPLILRYQRERQWWPSTPADRSRRS